MLLRRKDSFAVELRRQHTQRYLLPQKLYPIRFKVDMQRFQSNRYKKLKDLNKMLLYRLNTKLKLSMRASFNFLCLQSIKISLTNYSKKLAYSRKNTN